MSDLPANIEITPQEVEARIARGDAFLFVDVREKWEHETARIEGAELIPLREIPGHLARLAAAPGHSRRSVLAKVPCSKIVPVAVLT